MKAYIIRRLLLVIPTLLLLSIIVFLTVRFIPGDVIDAMLAQLLSFGADIDRETLERRLGLDVPVWVQYGRWIGEMFRHGSLGTSLWRDWTVEEEIFSRLPVTIELGLLAILIGLVIALPVGIYSAMRQDTAADYLGRSVAIIGLATPNFWLAIMVLIYPTIWWGWTPPLEYVPFAEHPLEKPLGVLDPQPDSGVGHGRRHHADDAHHDAGRCSGRTTSAPPGPRGWGERVVIIRHTLKNALIPVVTLVGCCSLPDHWSGAR